MARTDLHPQKLIEMGKWIDYRDPIWGNSYTWSWERPTTQVKYLVIHHTVTKHEATPDDIALLHKARGWGGIGYHFVITKDGTVYYVGDVSTARANVLNKNEQVIGITLVGDFTKYNPSDQQIVSAHYLCKYFLDLANYPQLNSWDKHVVGHKELQATQCPGTFWKNVAGVPDTLFERIKNNIPFTSPTPQPTPPPEPIPPTDPCADWKNKYNQSTRDIANLDTELKSANTELQSTKTRNINLANRNDELTKLLEIAEQNDIRLKTATELLSASLSKLFNKKVVVEEKND